MKPFLVSYDLNKPGQDYADLISRLKQLGAVRVLYSQWALQTTMGAAELRDDLRAYLDSNDRILVLEISGTWAYANLMASDRFKEIAA